MYRIDTPLTLTTIIDEASNIFPLKEIENNTLFREDDHPEKKLFPTIDHSSRPDKEIPDLFDGRTEWIDYLPPLYFQKSSSWNTALARTLAARISIMSNGQVSPNLSYNYLTTCPKNEIIKELNAINGKEKEGDSNYFGALLLYCYGTTIITCFNDKEKNKTESCNKASELKCKDEEEIFRLVRTCFSANIASNIKSIKWELSKFGPVVATMKVPKEFYSYNGLLPYENPSSEITGSRSVVIVGWTKLKDTEYWIVDPCIGYSWGLGGYFLVKINIGLGIEKTVLSIYPDFNIFSGYVDKFYANQKKPLPPSLEKIRDNIKTDTRYFTVLPTPPDQISRIIQRSDFIYKKFLPNYDTFFAKDVAYTLSYNVTSSTHGLKRNKFLLITAGIIIFLFLLYKLAK